MLSRTTAASTPSVPRPMYATCLGHSTVSQSLIKALNYILKDGIPSSQGIISKLVILLYFQRTIPSLCGPAASGCWSTPWTRGSRDGISTASPPSRAPRPDTMLCEILFQCIKHTVNCQMVVLVEALSSGKTKPCME